MAKTVDGWLHLLKGEQKAIEVVLQHAEKDIAYNGGGTYTNGKLDDNGYREVDIREIEKAKRGIEIIRWIVKTYCE